MAEKVLTLCRDTNIKVTTILNEISKKDDVTEFITTIQLIQVTINGLIRSKREFSFEYLKDLQNALVSYETLLGQLNAQPGGLLRFFTSNRLRRKIEIANATLHIKLEKFRESIKEEEAKPPPPASSSSTSLGSVARTSSNSNLVSSTGLTTSKENLLTPEDAQAEDESDSNLRLSLMIEDKDGKDLWAHLFGLETFMIKWEKFLSSLRTIIEIKDEEAKVLQFIIDNSNTGQVNQHKFSEFLKGFGPVQDCIKNAKSILSARWFYGFLSRSESELLLRDQPVGTFLIRFSSSQPGSFALAYTTLHNGSQSTFHILINSSKPIGFQVPENNTARTFQSLYEIVDYYNVFLQTPLVSDLPFESWFEGDYSGSEATEVLVGHKQGTFLVRFSTSNPGSYAVSFVTADGQPSHSLIEHEGVSGGGYRIENSISFPTLKDVVRHYGETLQHPLKAVTNELFVEATKHILSWKKDRAKQMEAIGKTVSDLFNVAVELPADSSRKVDEKDPRVATIIARLFDNI